MSLPPPTVSNSPLPKMSAHSDTKPQDPDAGDDDMKSLTTHFLSGTSAHALPRVVASGSWIRRALWLVLFVVAFSYFIYQTSYLLNNFLTYPVAVRIKVEHKPMQTFPSVTVCNMNMIRKTAVFNDSRYSGLIDIDRSAKNKVGQIMDKIRDRDEDDKKKKKKRKKRSVDESLSSRDSVTGKPATKGTEDKKDNGPDQAKDRDPPYTKDRNPGNANEVGSGSSNAGTKKQIALENGRFIMESDALKPKTSSDRKRGALTRVRRAYEGGSGSGDYDHDSVYDMSYMWGEDEDTNQIDDYGEADWWEGKDYKERFEDYEDEEERFEYEDYGFRNVENDYDFDDFVRASKTNDYSDLLDIVKPTTEDLDKYGHKKEKMVVQCSIDKKSCSHTIVDNIVTARKPTMYNPYFGNCYTFNHGQGDNATLHKTSKFGSRYGLRLTLNTEYEEYLGLIAHKVGIRIAVHPHNVAPFPEDYGVSAAPGRETEIGVALEVVKRQQDPHPSNCTDGAPYKLNFPGNYTITACAATCLQNKLMEKCGCYDKRVMPATTPKCSLTNETEERCRQHLYHLYDTRKLGCDCPTACQDDRYKVSASSTKWPSAPYQYLLATSLITQSRDSFLKGNLMDIIEDNMVRVHVYMETPTVVTIEEYPSYPWDRLLADIGGLLGLFIGVSACTAAELVEFAVDAVIMGFKRCRKRRQGRQVSPGEPRKIRVEAAPTPTDNTGYM